LKKFLGDKVDNVEEKNNRYILVLSNQNVTVAILRLKKIIF